MNRHPQTATDDPLVAACSLCSFAVSEHRKGKIPARLQELQTANGSFHLQESTKKNIMNGYRFHLQKYRPGKDSLSGMRQEVLLYPLYRRGGRDFLPWQRGYL